MLLIPIYILACREPGGNRILSGFLVHVKDMICLSFIHFLLPFPSHWIIIFESKSSLRICIVDEEIMN